jgi:hypothetical protein
MTLIDVDSSVLAISHSVIGFYTSSLNIYFAIFSFRISIIPVSKLIWYANNNAPGDFP